ncbi:hypothetical protein AD951_06410 [Acetobacter malorum]|uniref:CobQ/CobB/MinD/ParA nucleotide binding domain-containing protein n=1 Tax=Acetobacter malorum TaxID=178901 RepID=A0A149UNT3_9PROT|nr:hypothetical protein [Acetobacter malorum]KXV69463.1 hypothetical protein AD951_06410 [Acetobacter malorum]
MKTIKPVPDHEVPVTLKTSLAQKSAITPCCLIFAGRGGTGKSTHARLHAEWIERSGLSLKIADLDRTNATLTAFYPNLVEAPRTADDKDVMTFLEDILERQIEEKYHLILDFGDGDLVLKNLALRLDLVGFFRDYAIQPVLFHHLGADLDYLAYLASLEEDGLFRPEKTIVVLNEFIKPSSQSVEVAFETIMRSRQLGDVLKRGARMISLPDLLPAPGIDRKRLRFYEAVQNRQSVDIPPLGPIKRQMLVQWLRTVGERFREADVDLPWIPAEGQFT